MKTLGKYNEDGSVKSWPETDINGQPYERTNATMAGIDPETFVVIPAGFTDPDGKLAKLREERAAKVEAAVIPEPLPETWAEPKERKSK